MERVGKGYVLRCHLYPGIMGGQDQSHYIPTKMDVRVMVQLLRHRPNAIRENQGGPNKGSGRYSNWLILNTKVQGGFDIRKLW